MNCTGKQCIMQYDKVDPATCQCVPYCPQATPPKTNADLIRSMTDKELAEWLSCNSTGDGYGNSTEDWLNWLKEEYKNEH